MKYLVLLSYDYILPLTEEKLQNMPINCIEIMKLLISYDIVMNEEPE
jgi:hypothetical protein